MCRFSLSGCTQLETFHRGASQSFTPSPPGSQRALLREPWGFLGAVLEHGGLGLRGCCGAGLLEGRTWRGEPVAVSSSQSSGTGFSVPPHHLWGGVCPWHGLLTGSRPCCPSAAPASAHQSWVGAKHGQEEAKPPRSPLEQDPRKALPLSLTHSLTPTVPWCSGLTQPLIYEPSTWLVVWWLLF